MQRRRPRGRRPGGNETREAILAAAQAAFTEHGYAGATIRGVAREAGVDQALVLHFFGSKDGLFEAALRANPPIRGLAEMLATAPWEELGERLVRHYLAMWEDPETSGRLRAIVSSVSVSPSAASMVARFIGEVAQEPLARRLGAEDARVRANLAGSHLFGTAAARYILRVEPLASLPREDLVTWLVPVIQHYLTGQPDQCERSAAASSSGRSSGKNSLPPSTSTTSVTPGMVSRSQ